MYGRSARPARAACLGLGRTRSPTSSSGPQPQLSVLTTVASLSIPGLTGVRLVDCGNIDAYSRAHIPGAHRLPTDPLLKDPSNPGHVFDPALFVQLCSALGIDAATHVVAYDGGSVVFAARLYWTLSLYGVAASVLDGQWPAYVRSGQPVSIAPPDDVFSPSPPTGIPVRSLLATKQDVLAVVQSNQSSGVQLIDTRSRAEFEGLDLRGNARGGHVPGAINVPHNTMLTPEGALFEPAELRRLFESSGVDLTCPTVVYCQAGIRACVGLLALQVAGASGTVANYDGSMREWLRDETMPIEIK
jgi:thiosulfate/3-mercaptopyruvate sulfurtransferase